MHTARDLWIGQGVDCELVAVGDSVGDFEPTLEQSGYRIHHLKPSRFSLLFGFFVLLLKRKPDVVHIHTERASFWLALESRLLRKRVVQTVHNIFNFSDSLQTERRIQRRIARSLGVKFVAVGPDVAKHELLHFGNNAEVIWNWVDLEKFSPPTQDERSEARRALGLSESDFTVITVGNCWPQKNHSLVIHAMALPTTPPDVVYLHVGDDSVGIGAEERILATKQSITSRIRFLGTRSDVARLLHASDLFLMPSEHEGIGLAAVEALACNVPVLLGNSPGLHDLHLLSSEVRLTDVDARAISEAIAEAHQMSRAGDMHFEGREVATLWFDPTRGVTRYAEVYRGQPQGGPR